MEVLMKFFKEVLRFTVISFSLPVMFIVFVIVVNKYFQVLDLSIFTYEIESQYEMETRRRAYAKEFANIYDPTKTQFIANKSANSIPILNYHGISDTPYKGDILTDTFKDHMYSLKNAGYNTITLAEFLAFVQGEKDLPENSILITFDDGIKSSFIKATPIFDTLDFNAVMFVITKFSMHEGTHYYLSLEEVKQMAAMDAWEIQAHAYDSHHRILVGPDEYGTYLGNKIYDPETNRLETDAAYRKRVSNEFSNAYSEFEKYMGYAPVSFAYPFGDYGHISKNFPEAKKVLAEEIKPYFNTANFFQTWPSQGPSRNYAGEAPDNLYRRISVHPDWSGAEILRILDNGSPKSLDYADDFSTNKGWKSLWGEVNVNDGQLQMKPIEGYSAGAFLDGTISWSEYELVAKTNSFEGDSLSIAFNFIDKKNFDSCEFSGKHVKIERRRNGETQVLADTRVELDQLELPNLEVGLKNTDEKIVCFVNGEEFASLDQTPVTNDLDSGGISFIIWDAEGNTELNVETLFVSEIRNSN